MELNGTFFDGRSARAHEAVLQVRDKVFWVTGPTGALLCEETDLRSGLDITPKLGKTRRVMRFRDGCQFETNDFEGVAAIEKQFGINQPFRVVGFLEARWLAVFLCVAGLIGFVYVSMVYGLPWAARTIAYNLPPSVMDGISKDALQIMDRRFFQPSGLPESERERIHTAFLSLTRDVGEGYAFSLQFRKSEALGANAFAMPSGTIIVTDDLVTAAADLREIQGVLIHEISHVTHRHAMRSVIQNTGVVLLISLLVGDVTSITSLAASIPTLLLETGYSRRFEIEADMAVGRYFLSRNWPIKPYEDILLRITGTGPASRQIDLFSTHPDVRERIERLRRLTLK